MYYGWYSEKQASSYGFAVFETVDGSFVRVSETSSEDKPSGNWSDYYFVGLVKRLICNYDPNGRPRPPLTMDELADRIEITDEDIIESKPSIIMNATAPNSKREWDGVCKAVNTNLLWKKTVATEIVHSN